MQLNLFPSQTGKIAGLGNVKNETKSSQHGAGKESKWVIEETLTGEE